MLRSSLRTRLARCQTRQSDLALGFKDLGFKGQGFRVLGEVVLGFGSGLLGLPDCLGFRL